MNQCLEALKNLELGGNKLEVHKANNYQLRNPKANLFVSNLHLKINQEIF